MGDFSSFSIFLAINDDRLLLFSSYTCPLKHPPYPAGRYSGHSLECVPISLHSGSGVDCCACEFRDTGSKAIFGSYGSCGSVCLQPVYPCSSLDMSGGIPGGLASLTLVRVAEDVVSVRCIQRCPHTLVCPAPGPSLGPPLCRVVHVSLSCVSNQSRLLH